MDVGRGRTGYGEGCELGIRGHHSVGGDAESQGRHLPRGALGLRIGGGGGGLGVKTDRGGSRDLVPACPVHMGTTFLHEVI